MPKPRVAILDDYQGVVRSLRCISMLEAFDVTIVRKSIQDIGVLSNELIDFDAIVLIRERTKISEALIARLPRLKLISQTGRLGDHIDLDACQKYGITVMSGKGSPIAPAELTWGLILASMRNIVQEHHNLRHGDWQKTLGTSVAGRTLGVVGYGKIGRIVAKMGHSFGMQVLAFGREASQQRAFEDGVSFTTDKKTVLSKADVISLHLRFSPETAGFISYKDFSFMKPTALFVNTARAELVERGALEKALMDKLIAKAAVDVFEEEPLHDTSHPLLRLENVVATPHIGYVEQDNYEAYFATAFENVRQFFKGEGT